MNHMVITMALVLQLLTAPKGNTDKGSGFEIEEPQRDVSSALGAFLGFQKAVRHPGNPESGSWGLRVSQTA